MPDFYLIDFHGEMAFVGKNFIASSQTVTALTHIYHYLAETDKYTHRKSFFGDGLNKRA